MTQIKQTDAETQETLLRALDQVMAVQETHTKFLQRIMEVLTTEPESSGIVDAIHALSKNVEAQTQTIAAQARQLETIREAMVRIVRELEGAEAEARPQPSQRLR